MVHELAPTAELVGAGEGLGEGQPEREGAVGRSEVQGARRQPELAAGLDGVHLRLGHAGQADLGQLPGAEAHPVGVYEGLSVPIDAGAAHREPLFRQDADDAAKRRA